MVRRMTIRTFHHSTLGWQARAQVWFDDRSQTHITLRSSKRGDALKAAFRWATLMNFHK